MGWIIQTSSQVLQQLAEQRRRVVASWRIWIEARRFAQIEGAPLPDEQSALKILRRLLRTGDLVSVPSARDVYRAESPYATVLPASEEQVIQEANPSAVFSHLTALAHHGLTDQIPSALYVTQYTPADPHRIPLGTTPEEWSELPVPPQRHPKQVGSVAVHWVRTKGEWDFGYMASFSQGLPIYVTSPERALIDALRAPEQAGGISNVLRAWKRAKETMNLEKILDYTDRFGEGVLRQRAGYLIESLGLSHPRLAEWKLQLARGGSLRLVASAPYAPQFSPEWNLSLNVSTAVLSELEGD